MSATVHLLPANAADGTRAAVAPGAVVLYVSSGALAPPAFDAAVIVSHLEPGWRTLALLTALRAAHPDATIIDASDGSAGRRGPVARMLAALFDRAGADGARLAAA